MTAMPESTGPGSADAAAAGSVPDQQAPPALPQGLPGQPGAHTEAVAPPPPPQQQQQQQHATHMVAGTSTAQQVPDITAAQPLRQQPAVLNAPRQATGPPQASPTTQQQQQQRSLKGPAAAQLAAQHPGAPCCLAQSLQKANGWRGWVLDLAQPSSNTPPPLLQQQQQWPHGSLQADKHAPLPPLPPQRSGQPTWRPQQLQQQQQHPGQAEALRQHQLMLQQQQLAQLQLWAQQQHRQQQQLAEPRHAPATAAWGWWRRAGQRALLGLDPVRLPLLQLHASVAPHQHGNSQRVHANSEVLLQRLRADQQGQQAQQPASSSLRAECWQLLLSAQQQHQQQQQRGRQPRPAKTRPPQQRRAMAVPPTGQQQQPPVPNEQHAAAAALSCGVPAPDGGTRRAAGAAADTAAAAAADGRAPGQGAAAAATAAALVPSKAVKRPWQPKMLPDEPNWDKAAFAAVQARSVQAKGAPGSKLPRSQPEHSTATFAMLSLLHNAGWPNHLLWEQWQAAHPPGTVALFAHMKAGVSLGPGMPGRELIAKCKLRASVDSRWGDISLVLAQLESLAEVLRRCPHVSHIGLASGHDIPVALIRPGLLLPGVTLFGAYQFGPTETRTLKVAVVDQLVSDTAMCEAEAQSWGQALTFHHQWMILSREHAAALVLHTKEIMLIGRVLHKACCSVRAGMAPDEFVVVTALRQRGYVRSVQRVEVQPGMRYPPGSMLNSYPTFVVFPAESSPHPVMWSNLEHVMECQVDDHTGAQQRRKRLSLSSCLDICVQRRAIFFRKVEIRQTRGEDLVMLLSSLEAMWMGRRKVDSGAAKSHSTNSSAGMGNKRGRAKRKKAALGVVLDGEQPSRDGSPASSAVVSDAAMEVGIQAKKLCPSPPLSAAETCGA